VAFALRGKKPEYLLTLPTITKPKEIAIMKIFANIGVSAFFIDSNVFAMTITIGMRLTLKYGMSLETPFLYSGFGAVLSGGLSDFDRAKTFGELGLKLTRKLESRKQLCKTSFVYSTVLQHWKQPLKDSIPLLQEGYLLGLETGDFDFAAFNLFICDLHSFLTGKKLDDILADAIVHNNIIRGFKQNYITVGHSLLLQSLLQFSRTDSPQIELSGNIIDAEQERPLWIKEENRYALGIYYFARISLRVIYNHYSLALEDADMYRKYKDALRGAAINRLALVFDSLVRLMEYPKASLFKKIQFRFQIKINQLRMWYWCRKSDGYNLNYYYGIQALIEWRIKNNLETAKQDGELAISLCERPDDLMAEAFIQEHLSNIYDALGYRESAKNALVSSYLAYREWGALGKNAQMLAIYPDLAAHIPQFK